MRRAAKSEPWSATMFGAVIDGKTQSLVGPRPATRGGRRTTLRTLRRVHHNGIASELVVDTELP
jgi:hypothetical protein